MIDECSIDAQRGGAESRGADGSCTLDVENHKEEEEAADFLMVHFIQCRTFSTEGSQVSLDQLSRSFLLPEAGPAANT